MPMVSQPAGKIADLRVRFAEEFDENAACGIAADKDAGDEPRRLQSFAAIDDIGKDKEQQNALEKSLVKLARVARERTSGREDDRPGHGREPPPELAVDEIGNAAEEEADRDDGRHDIEQAPDGDGVPAGKDDDRECRAQKTAMEGHAAVPDLDGADRVLQHRAEVVEEDVAEASAEHDAAGRPKQEVIELRQTEWGRIVAPERRILGYAPGVEPAEQDAGDIGETIPVYGERSDREDHRIDFGEGENGKAGNKCFQGLLSCRADRLGGTWRSKPAWSSGCPGLHVGRSDFPCILVRTTLPENDRARP
ncbi:hypothetical protein ABIA27_004235 [Sinorhizobium fredii]